jgi:hypothetical protein
MEKGKMGVEAFIMKAIPVIRDARHAELVAKAVAEGRKVEDVKEYKGIHSVYSGFNTLLRDYYGKDFDVVGVCNELAKRKVIVTVPTKGGCTIYLPKDAPRNEKDLSGILAKIVA